MKMHDAHYLVFQYLHFEKDVAILLYLNAIYFISQQSVIDTEDKRKRICETLVLPYLSTSIEGTGTEKY